MANILIIDDSPTDVRVFTTLLERAGHQVVAVSTAEEGIERVRADLPSLVIMDVIMPGMNGFQATRTLDPRSGHGGGADRDDHHQVDGNRPCLGLASGCPRVHHQAGE